MRYLIIGGEAVIYYGHARLTGHIDFLFENTPQNIQRVYDTLLEFWEGDIPGLQEKGELEQVGSVFQFGVPPNRIDLLNHVDGVSFDQAWKHRETDQVGFRGRAVSVYFVGLEDLIRNKERMDRPKDQEDLKYLRRALEKRK